MSLTKRLLPLAVALAAILSSAAQNQPKSASDGSIRYTVSLDEKRQTFEGWGFTLCWWANVTGNWDDEHVFELVDWLVNDLGIRIFRYNIGGGDDPAFTNCEEHHMIHNSYNDCKGARAEMEGFMDADGSYHWDRDRAQIRIMRMIHEICPDAIFEAFANSAPYFMTESGCVGGNDRGPDGAPKENLPRRNYEAFCRYLVTVLKHHHDEYGINFRTISPANEPGVWAWYRSGSQEGCCFSDESLQELVKTLEPILAESGLDTRISGMEQTSVAHGKRNLDQMHDAGMLDKIAQFNVHTYEADRRSRTQVASLGRAYGRRVWMSEVCYGSYDLAGDLQAMRNIFDDIRYILPEAWVEWQFLDSFGGENNEHGWGCIGANFYDGSQYYKRLKRYYLYKQVMTAIRPGDRLLTSLSELSLASINPEGNKLTLVVMNPGATATRHWVDLSAFASVGIRATATRTSATEDFATVEGPVMNGKSMTVDLPPYSVTTIRVDVAGAGERRIIDGATYWIVPRNAENMAVNYGGYNVDIQPLSYDPGQAWTATDMGNGAFRFTNGNGQILTGNTESYYMYVTEEKDKDYQYLYPVDYDGIFYTIGLGVDNLILDLEGEKYDAGTRVGRYTDNGYAGDTHRHFLLVRQPEQKKDVSLSFNIHDTAFRAKTGETHSQKLTVNATADVPVTFAVHDGGDGLSASCFSVSPARLDGPGEVTVTYSPQSAGSHWAWISATADGAEQVYSDVHGNAYDEPVIDVQGETTFNAVDGAPVTNTFTLKGTGLIGAIEAGTWDTDWQLFAVTLPWAVKKYDTIMFENRAGWTRPCVYLYNPADPLRNQICSCKERPYPLVDQGNGLYTIPWPMDATGFKIAFTDGMESCTYTDLVDYIPGAVYYAGGKAAERFAHAVPALADIDETFDVTYTPGASNNAKAQIWIKTAGRPDNVDIPVFATNTTDVSDVVVSVPSVTVGDGFVRVDGCGVAGMTLYNLSGAAVAASHDGLTRTAGLPAAAYLLHISMEDGGRSVHKILLR